MLNRKWLMCIMLFLVVLVFGILAPELKDRDYAHIDSEETTEYKVEQTSENTLEPGTQVTEIVDIEPTEEVEILTTEAVVEVPVNTNPYILSDQEELMVYRLVEGMTIEEKVGQLFFIKDDGRFDYNILLDYPVGGIIMFKGDFVGKSKDELKKYISDFQENSDIPLLIGIDEEGGTVVRLSCYSELADYQFQSPKALYYSHHEVYDGIHTCLKEDAEAKSELLKSYGINVNFAPVCDVATDPNDFMYKRAFGDDVDETCEYVEQMVSTMNDCDMGSVLKHFPGYGNNGDTHRAVVRDTRDYQEFVKVDFKPFEAGIESGAWCILVNHIIVEAFDKDMPASLSEEVHNILRERFEFGGVIITDDLMMGGVADMMDKGEAAVCAIKAGNDMILSTDYDVQYNAVLEAVQSGEITEGRLDQSVRRVLRWKIFLGIIEVE